MTILASATTAVLLAVGVGAFAILVGGVVVMATLGSDDRSQVRALLRHPVRAILSEDEPDGGEPR